MTEEEARLFAALRLEAQRWRRRVAELEQIAARFREEHRELGGWRAHILGASRTNLRLADRAIARHLEATRRLP